MQNSCTIVSQPSQRHHDPRDLQARRHLIAIDTHHEVREEIGRSSLPHAPAGDQQDLISIDVDNQVREFHEVRVGRVSAVTAGGRA